MYVTSMTQFCPRQDGQNKVLTSNSTTIQQWATTKDSMFHWYNKTTCTTYKRPSRINSHPCSPLLVEVELLLWLVVFLGEMSENGVDCRCWFLSAVVVVPNSSYWCPVCGFCCSYCWGYGFLGCAAASVVVAGGLSTFNHVSPVHTSPCRLVHRCAVHTYWVGMQLVVQPMVWWGVVQQETWAHKHSKHHSNWRCHSRQHNRQ